MAAIAGSRLISTANVAAGSLRNASSSSVYGRTDDISATASPSPSVEGTNSRAPASTSPNGRLSSAPAPIASASPSACGKRRPVRALKTMYAAHMPPAARANAAPAGSSRSKPPPPSSTTPPRASPAHSRFTSLREANTDRASGPSTSRVTAAPSGIRSTAW